MAGTQREVLEDALETLARMDERLGRVEESLRAAAGVDALVAQGLKGMEADHKVSMVQTQVELRAVREQLATLIAAQTSSPWSRFLAAATQDAWALRGLVLAGLVLAAALATAVGGEMLPTTISVLLNRDGGGRALQIAPEKPVNEGQEQQHGSP